MLPENRNERNALLSLVDAGIAAVMPDALLDQRLARVFPGRDMHLLAIGKAASGMARAAAARLGDRLVGGVVVGPEGSGDVPQRLRFLAGEHPVPGESSFHAGEAVLDWLHGLGDGEPLLVLLSGGGSSLLELPVDGVSRKEIRAVNHWCLGSGLPIAAVNAIRGRLSQVKAGGLAAVAAARDLEVLALSDIVDGVVETVASGPFSKQVADAWPADQVPVWIADLADGAVEISRASVPVECIGDNATALSAIRSAARSMTGQYVVSEGQLEGDVATMAGRLADQVRQAPPGLLVFGGETTVTLPDDPGRGGRNQQLALLLARELQDIPGWCAAAVGSDGVDGNSEDAGALVDGGTVARAVAEGFDIDDALHRADAGPLLEAAGDLVHTGPTGTNVADIFVALKWQA